MDDFSFVLPQLFVHQCIEYLLLFLYICLLVRLTVWEILPVRKFSIFFYIATVYQLINIF